MFSVCVLKFRQKQAKELQQVKCLAHKHEGWAWILSILWQARHGKASIWHCRLAGSQRRWMFEAPGPASLTQSISCVFSEMPRFKSLQWKATKKLQNRTWLCLHTPVITGAQPAPNTGVQTHTFKKKNWEKVNLILIIIVFILLKTAHWENRWDF